LSPKKQLKFQRRVSNDNSISRVTYCQFLDEVNFTVIAGPIWPP
jgi:hypothetical protein